MELFHIARCTLIVNDYRPRASQLFSRMMAYGGSRTELTKQLRKVFHHYTDIFQKFGKTYEEVNTSILKIPNKGEIKDTIYKTESKSFE